MVHDAEPVPERAQCTTQIPSVFAPGCSRPLLYPRGLEDGGEAPRGKAAVAGDVYSPAKPEGCAVSVLRNVHAAGMLDSIAPLDQVLTNLSSVA